MYMDNIKLFAKEKRNWWVLYKLKEYSVRMLGIEKCAMLIMKNGKKTNNRRNRTIKSRKNQNAWRKGNLQVLGNIGSRLSNKRG